MQLSNKSLGMGPEVGPSRVCQDTHGDTGFLTNVSTGRSPASHKQAAATPATRRQLRLPPVYFCALLWSVKLSWQASLFSTLCMIQKRASAGPGVCHATRTVLSSAASGGWNAFLSPLTCRSPSGGRRGIIRSRFLFPLQFLFAEKSPSSAGQRVMCALSSLTLPRLQGGSHQTN